LFGFTAVRFDVLTFGVARLLRDTLVEVTFNFLADEIAQLL